jgi:Flp pilus assembly protein TadG
MKPRLRERGQALIMIALAAVGLFGFSALAIDGSRVFSDRRHAQNAADTAALAAALARVRATGSNLDVNGNPIQSAIDAATVDAGIKRAESNGYANDTDSSVDVNMCDTSGLNPPCEGLPGGANPAEYIQVKIVSTIPTTFARIIGRAQVTSILTAVARAKSGIPSPLFKGAALAALAPSGSNTLGGNGNVFLDVNNSGTFNNSIDNCGMKLDGNGVYSVDTSFEVVSGQHCESGHPATTGSFQTAGQVPYPPAITIPTPIITCSGTGTKSDSVLNGVPVTTLTPGNWGSLNLVSSGEVHFSPGNYCFSNGVSMLGPDVIANNVNLLITGGEFKISGNGSFTCDNMLVYINGGSGIHFNGNGGSYCNDVTFFAKTGDVTWNGSVSNRFFAPKGGDYKNVLIYMPYGNNSPLTINGSSGSKMTGSIIAVSSAINISGVSDTTGLHSQIIGYTITLDGASNTTINYVAGEQYAQADPSGIMLTK